MARNTFTVFGILAVLLLSFGLTSAGASENNFTISINGDGTSGNPVVGASGESVDFTIDFVNTNLDYPQVNLSWSGVDISSGVKNDTGSTSFTPTVDIGTGSSHGLTVIVTNDTGDVIATLTKSIYYLDNTTPTTTEDTFCELEEYTETSYLEISDFDITNNGEGSDDEWEYLDQIEITVEIENTDNEDVEDVEVTIMILDDNGADKTSKFDFDKKTIKSIGRLRDDDTEEVTFIIDELSSDLEEGDYYMYIMANGEDEDGNDQCISEIDGDGYFFEFTIESVDYEDSVLARGSELEQQINVYCGQENLEITVPIYNLGDDEEERVLVNLYSSAMGIDEYAVINDLDNGDKEVVTFFINVPEGLPNERYNLEILTSFDWDDDRDEDDETSYDEQTTESIRLNILGCASPEPSIRASLESDTEVGTNLVVRAIIKNNGDLGDFTIAATGFESWAKLISVTPSLAEIASGNSQEVTITLSPTESGVHAFEITTIVDGETYGQIVSVNIAEKQYPFGISSTAFYLGIAVVALGALTLLILIVKVARRPTATPNF
jgi:uncharacterized membrane protein